MKTYEGIRTTDEKNTVGESTVLVDGQALSPVPSQKVMNHSPDGFNWGYNGSGPAQLALAILLDYYGDRDYAIRMHQNFKAAIVARWPHDGGWKITSDEVEAACKELEG